MELLDFISFFTINAISLSSSVLLALAFSVRKLDEVKSYLYKEDDIFVEFNNESLAFDRRNHKENVCAITTFVNM